MNTTTPQTTNNLEDFFGPMLYAYTRQMAIEDGTLIDLSALYPAVVSRHFKLPLAMNSGVYAMLETHVANSQPLAMETVLNALLWMFESKANDDLEGDRIFLKFPFRSGPDTRKSIDLVLHCGPGDDDEAVLTICEPGDL